jgi:hypothetical protein
MLTIVNWEILSLYIENSKSPNRLDMPSRAWRWPLQMCPTVKLSIRKVETHPIYSVHHPGTLVLYIILMISYLSFHTRFVSSF